MAGTYNEKCAVLLFAKEITGDTNTRSYCLLYQKVIAKSTRVNTMHELKCLDFLHIAPAQRASSLWYSHRGSDIIEL